MKFDILHSFYKRWKTKSQDSPDSIQPKPSDFSSADGSVGSGSETDDGDPVTLQNTPLAVPEITTENGNYSGSGADIPDTVDIAAREKEIFNEMQQHPDIFSSLREVCRKYGLAELTLATDDGLVLATSASRDVEFDAVHYSQVVQLMTTPSEPDVSLYELQYKGSHLIGIIRANRHVPPIMRERIRDDTKVILQWWL